MDAIWICVILALVQTSLSNLGLGVQKAGVAWMEGGPWSRPRLSKLGLWVFGILMCIAGIVAQGVALNYGPASLVAVLGAFGLVPLYLFCRLVLKEPLAPAHIGSLVAIMAGVGYIGYYSEQAQDPSTFHPAAMLIGALCALLIPALAALWARQTGSPFQALALGCLAGSSNGLALLMLKVGAVKDAWLAIGALWLGASALGFVVIQWAYQQGDAVQVVPSNTALAIVVPVLIAPWAFDEQVSGWLLGGLLLILGGIVLLGFGEKAVARRPSLNQD
ncbi:MAG: hypothetical protein AB7S38_15595 [Vulcanimicrobiota bacterium]